MNDLADLHDVLHDLEIHAPDTATVRARFEYDISRPERRQFTRYAVPLTAAATVLAVGSLSFVVASTQHGGPGRRHGAASVAAPGAPKPASTGKPAQGPARTELTWRFDVGAVPGYDIKRLEISATAQYADVTVHGQPKSVGEVAVYSRGALDTAELTTGAAAGVHGKAGYFALFQGKPTLGWQYADGAWALVSGDWGYRPASGTYDMAAARAAEQSVADAVDTSKPAPFLVDFRLAWLPAGLVTEQGVDVFGPNDSPLIEIGFGDGKPGDTAGKATYGGSALTVSRQLAWQDPAPNLTVAGRSARYDATVGQLIVNLPDGTDLVIAADGKHTATFSKADLIRIAENATFVPSPSDRSTWIAAAQAVPR